jgi:alpha-tubulin suppressor-like RCC1 family protein
MLALHGLSACDSNDGPGAPIPFGDSGRDVNYTVGETSPPVVSDASIFAEASAPIRSVVAVGNAFACVLAKDRTVHCWGRNDLGQLGRDPAATPSCGSFPCSATPTKVEGLVDVVRLTAGDDFACAIDSIGSVWCWGSNAKGQIGANSTAEAIIFKPRKVIVKVQEIGAGGAHACAITTDFIPYCWGENTCNIFGASVGPTQPSPRQAPGVPILSQVALGPDQICGTLTDGRVVCWGADHNGSLGHTLDPSPTMCNGFPSDPTPRFVQAKESEIPITSVADVHVGYGVACAKQVGGKVLCWGDNQLGALGQGIPDPLIHNRAQEVPALFAKQLDVRGQTPCAIVADRLLCWGDGSFGQLDSLGADSGCGGQGCRAFAFVVPGMSPVRDITAAQGSIATIKDDLSVWMWGRNTSGELAIPQSDSANQVCDGGNLCVPQPKKLNGIPPLD